MHADAITLLTEDHNRVKSLFDRYDTLGPQALDEKRDLARAICLALVSHASVEEEVFYPALRAARQSALGGPDQVHVLHTPTRRLISRLLELDPADAGYDEAVHALAEQLDHHVNEEESRLFPLARKARLDLGQLGAVIRQRQAELEA